MLGSYKIALYTVLHSEVDGNISLLPVRVCDVENARIMVAYSVRRTTFKIVTFVNVMRVFHSHPRTQR